MKAAVSWKPSLHGNTMGNRRLGMPGFRGISLDTCGGILAATSRKAREPAVLLCAPTRQPLIAPTGP